MILIIVRRSLALTWAWSTLGDLYPESEKEKDAEEPEWVKTEREHFHDFRDKNKDGKMDRVWEKECSKFEFTSKSLN